MVEADSDPAVVTAVILRETHEAAAERAAQESAGGGTSRAANIPVPVERGAGELQTGQEVVPRQEQDAPIMPVGITQILVASAIVVVLFFLWVAERRSRRLESGDGG